MNLLFLKYLDRSVGRFIEFILRISASIREMTGSPREKIEVNKILLIKLWGIGNIVMILPIIEGVRKKYPNATIYFLTLNMNCDLLEHNQNMDRVFALGVGSLNQLLSSSFRLLRELRREHIDICLDFEQFSRFTSIFGVIIGAKHKVGLFSKSGGRGHLYNLKVPFDNNQHMSLTFRDIAGSIGADVDPRGSHNLQPSTKGQEEVEEFLHNRVGNSDMLIGMHVGSSDNFPGRRWPKEKFARLADALVEEYEAAVVFTGGNKEVRLVEETISLMQRPAISSAGCLSISGLVALVDRCDLFFSNDTAPVHIASALDVPIVAFFGPNTPDLYGPTGNNCLVFYKKLPCSPCITNFNAKTSFCHFPVCIESITVEEVVEGVRQKFGAHLAGADSRRHRQGFAQE